MSLGKNLSDANVFGCRQWSSQGDRAEIELRHLENCRTQTSSVQRCARFGCIGQTRAGSLVVTVVAFDPLRNSEKRDRPGHGAASDYGSAVTAAILQQAQRTR